MKISAPESLQKARGREMLVVCLSLGGGILGRIHSACCWEQGFVESCHGVGAGEMKQDVERRERKSSE